MAHNHLSVHTEALGAILLVTADGRIDGNTILQLRLAIAAYGQVPYAFILDLKNVSYISSVGLNLLLTLEKRAQEHGRSAVVVAGTNESIKQVLSISGFDRIVHIFDDTAAAIASLGGDSGVQASEDICDSPLSRKQKIVLRTLRDNSWINAGIYGVVLLASRLARDPQNIIELVIGIGHLERIGVPVVDTILMIAETGGRLNCRWSARRWRQEHTRLSRRLRPKPPAADKFFKVVWVERALRSPDDPLRQRVILLDTPRRITEEGIAMQHCVGSESYMESFRKGSLACLAVVDSKKSRWTVTARPASAGEAKPSVVAIRGRFNALPDKDARERIAELLGPGIHLN